MCKTDMNSSAFELKLENNLNKDATITDGVFTIMEIYIRNAQHVPDSVHILIQVPLFIISAVFIVVGVKTALKFTVFHKNQRNILISMLLLWFELLLSRVLVWHFEYTFSGKYGRDARLLDDCSQYGICSIRDNLFDPIFIAANLRYHYMFSVICTPISMIAERIFATVLVRDYEKKSRRWIFGTIFLIQNLIAVTMALVTTIGGLTFIVLLTTSSTVLSSCAILYFVVVFVNSRRLLILEGDHRNTNYSLSIRYQLKENLKTLKHMRRFFIFIVVFIIIMGAANSIPVLLNWSEESILITRQYLDYIFHSNPIVLIPTAFIMIDNYRKHLFNNTRRAFGLRPESQKVDIRKLKAPQNVAEADVYFSIFDRQLNEQKNISRGSTKKMRRFK